MRIEGGLPLVKRTPMRKRRDGGRGVMRGTSAMDSRYCEGGLIRGCGDTDDGYNGDRACGLPVAALQKGAFDEAKTQDDSASVRSDSARNPYARTVERYFFVQLPHIDAPGLSLDMRKSVSSAPCAPAG